MTSLITAVLACGALLGATVVAAAKAVASRRLDRRARRRLSIGGGTAAGTIVGAAMALGLDRDSANDAGIAAALLALGAVTGLACGVVIRPPKTDARSDGPNPFLRIPLAMLWGAVVGFFVSELSWAGLVAIANLDAGASTPDIGIAVALSGMIVGALTRALSWTGHDRASPQPSTGSSPQLP